MSSEHEPPNHGRKYLTISRLFSIVSSESCEKATQFQPRPSDVIVVAPLKCGSTWMLQIVHQLRTGGDTDFVDINMEIPWLEAAHDCHLDLDLDQKVEPRAYKTHLPYSRCPKGCKYIAVCRDPCSAAYSLYKWLYEPPEGQIEDTDAMTLDETIATWLALDDLDNPMPVEVSYFTHLLSSLQHKDDPNVLLVFFEEMKEDLESVVRAVASFIGVRSEKNICTATELSSFKFMKANAGKFNPDVSLRKLKKKVGIDSYKDIVRTGSTDEAHKTLSDEQKGIIQQRWEKQVTKTTGYGTYDELRRAVREERPLSK